MDHSCRGVHVTSTSYSSSMTSIDESYQIFVCFQFSIDTLGKILSWCNITPQHFSKVSELFSFAENWGNRLKKQKILVAIVYRYLWCMCRARNDKFFNNICVSLSKLEDNIITLVFSWVNHRVIIRFCNWVDWCCSLSKLFNLYYFLFLPFLFA